MPLILPIYTSQRPANYPASRLVGARERSNFLVNYSVRHLSIYPLPTGKCSRKTKRKRSGRNRRAENGRKVKALYAVNRQKRRFFDNFPLLHRRRQLQPRQKERTTAGTDAKRRTMVSSLAVVAMGMAGQGSYFSRMFRGISNTGLRCVRTGQERQHQKVNGQDGGCCCFQPD